MSDGALRMPRVELVGARHHRSRRETRGLVVHGGDGADLGLVLAPVVGAEEQLAAGEEGGSHIGLRAAAVAAVEGRQWGGGRSGGHVVHLPSSSRAACNWSGAQSCAPLVTE